MTEDQISSCIVHTLFSPACGTKQIDKLCKEAVEYKFGAVCVNPVYVHQSALRVKGTGVAVCSTVSFPFGASNPSGKAAEAVYAVEDGADAVAMVLDISAAREKKFTDVQNDIAGVVTAVHSAGEKKQKLIRTAVILETCYLTDDQITECCFCAERAGAEFVCTCTGFGVPKSSDGSDQPNGASIHHVELMHNAIGGRLGIVANGGIRSARTASDLIKAGATLIAASSSLTILANWSSC